MPTLADKLNAFDPTLPLEKARTIPRLWYFDPEVYEAECRKVFGNTWLLAGRLDQVAKPGAYLTLTVAGEPILAKLTRAPGNQAAIGGLKVVAENGWFAARPSGTENIYKLYAESFVSAEHLARVVDEAQRIVGAALAG